MTTFPQDEADLYSKHDRMVLEGGETVEERRSVSYPDGQQRDVLIIKFPVPLEAGREGIVAVNVDLSEVKKTEERARNSEENFATAFRMNPDSIVITRADDGTILDVNDNCLELLGYQLGEMKNKVAAEFWHQPGSRAEFRRLMRETGSVNSFEAVLVGKDGRHHIVLASARFIEFNGTPAVLSISHDITARKQVEDTLRVSLNDLAEAQRMAHIGSWRWNLETDEVTWSDEHWAILGLEPGDVSTIEPEFFYSFVHPDDLKLVQDAGQGELETGAGYVLDFRIIRRDGKTRHVHTRSRQYMSDGDRLMVGTMQDVTARIRTEEELRQSKKRLNERAAYSSRRELGVGHQFR